MGGGLYLQILKDTEAYYYSIYDIMVHENVKIFHLCTFWGLRGSLLLLVAMI